MAAHATLRASDADRDAVAERLRGAALEGRLDTEELDERLGAALRARTYGELDALLADLPDASSVPWRRPRVQAVSTAQRTLALALPLLVTLAVVAAIVTVAVVAAAWWLVWVLMWFAVCGRRACAVRLAPRPPRRIGQSGPIV